MIFGYPIWIIAIICIAVFVAGYIDAIAGGGGLISLPVYLLCGIPTHQALGTNKMSSCIGTTASTLRYIKRGFVNWNLAIPSALLALSGAYVGTSLQLLVNGTYLRYVLVVVLIIVAFVVLKNKDFTNSNEYIHPWKQRIIVWGCSLVIGLYDGFYGPGTGTFLLIAFCKFGKLDLNTAAGNVKIANLSSNIGAFITSLIAGQVLVPIGLLAACFSFLGQYFGAGAMIKNGKKAVVPVIFIVLSLLFIKIVLELAGVQIGG